MRRRTRACIRSRNSSEERSSSLRILVLLNLAIWFDGNVLVERDAPVRKGSECALALQLGGRSRILNVLEIN